MDQTVVQRISQILESAPQPLDKHDIYVKLEREGLVTRFGITSNQIKNWLDNNATRVKRKGGWGSIRYVKKLPTTSTTNPAAGLWMTKTAEPWED